MAEERVQRRLAAILAADIVGYSRLMDADETGTLARLKSLRDDVFDPTVARFGGRIFKLTGDGALVEFASAVDAVQAAVEVQRDLERRNAALAEDDRQTLRIGVSLGDVIVEGDDLYGNGVNVAARLEAMAEPGGICISGTVHEQARTVGDIGFEDLGEQRVKNIDRPIQAFRVLLDPAAAQRHGAEKPGPRPLRRIRAMAASAGDARWKRPAIAAAVLVLLAAGATAWWEPWVTRVERASVERMVLPLPDKPSIAVLPFNSLRGDAGQEHFAEGLTEEIINNLASFENIFVIARNSTNKYRGKAVDVRTVAEDLAVRYVLEGSARRSGDTLRVTVQLIDAINGRHVWANKYDRRLRDVFELQDEITREIASRVVSKLEVAAFERRSRVRTHSPEAYESFLLGWRNFARFTQHSNAEAIRFLERAVELDPNYARAYSYLAYARRTNARRGWVSGPKDTLEFSFRLAKKAVSIDPKDSVTQHYLGNMYLQVGQVDQAIEHLRKAIALSPGAPDHLIAYAVALAQAGRGDDAVRNLETALRLNPHPRLSYLTRSVVVYYFSERYEQANVAFERLLRRRPTYDGLAAAWRAAIYAQLGQPEKARAARDAYLKIDPEYSIQGFFDRSRYPERARALLEQGLRKAGYPERARRSAPKLSIVVLPFDNLSGDKSQDYLADVITDQLTTYLARIPGTFVIARNTAFTFKGKPVDVKRVGSDLGVRFVLEGSVQPAGDRIRVNAQLIDADTGAHLWAEKFDRSRTDRFRMQDEIVARVSRALHIQLSEVEAARLSHPTDSNPEAGTLAIRCEAIFLRWGPARKQTQAGYKLCEQALRRDERNVRALSLLAIKHGFRVATGQSDDRPQDIRRSTDFAERAIAADPNYYMARYAKAVAHSVRGEHRETIIEAKHALDLNPSFVTAYMFMLAAGVYTGQPEKTIEWAAEATRISPRDPLVSAFIAFTGRAYFVLGKDDLAAKWLRESVVRNPRFPQNRIFLAGVLGASGHEAEASEVLKTYLSLKRTRSKTIDQWKRELRTDDPQYVAAFNRLTEGLRKAGMPETAPRSAPKLSIVVLPFDNLSGDTSKDYLADVITDQLTTYLARIPGTFVIARNTAFTYKGKAVDVKQVGKDLGVKYLLEGSVQPSGDQVRINAQLINTQSGAHLWARKFDRRQSDPLQFQDQIVTQLARSLHIELSAVDAARLDRPEASNPAADALAVQCEALLIASAPASPQMFKKGYPLCEQALRIDPENVRALSILAIRHGVRVVTGISRDREEDTKRTIEFASMALDADPKSYLAHFAQSYAHTVVGKHAGTIVEGQRALDLNPSFVSSYITMLAAALYIGEPAKTLEWARKAIQLSPRDPLLFGYYTFLGRAHFMAGQDAHAIKNLRKAVALNPRFTQSHIHLAAVLGATDREDEAKQALKSYLSLKRTRSKTIAQWKRELRTKNPQYVATFERLTEGLRKAGMPEN